MKILDPILHVVGGIALLLGVVWNPWMAGPVALAFGMLREQAQHREEGWVGWITPHRLLEAAEWGVGGVIASLIGVFVV